MDLITTYFVETKDSKVDGRGLALFEEFHEQVVQIARVVVGEQPDDDIDIPRKFSLHSESVYRIGQRGGCIRSITPPRMNACAYRGIIPIVFPPPIFFAFLPCK